jgi:hypothetical protein
MFRTGHEDFGNVTDFLKLLGLRNEWAIFRDKWRELIREANV